MQVVNFFISTLRTLLIYQTIDFIKYIAERLKTQSILLNTKNSLLASIPKGYYFTF